MSEEKLTKPLTADAAFKVFHLVAGELYDKATGCSPATQLKSALNIQEGMLNAALCSIVTTMSVLFEATEDEEVALHLIRKATDEVGKDLSDNVRTMIADVFKIQGWPDPFDPNAKVREEILNGDL